VANKLIVGRAASRGGVAQKYYKAAAACTPRRDKYRGAQRQEFSCRAGGRGQVGREEKEQRQEGKEKSPRFLST
jgi:hypothetical protein